MKKIHNELKSPYGFTLIELLAVTAIVAILLAVLIPVISNVRTTALRSQSASNLRQVFAACQLYSNDHQNYLPNAFIAANEETGRKQSGWWAQLVDGDYLGNDGNSPAAFEVLGSPIQRREVPELTTDRDPPVYVTFGMNNVLSMLGKNQTKGLKANQLLAPSRTLYIAEGHLKPGNSWFGLSINPWGQAPNNTDGITTFAYADGHIGQVPDEEFMREMGPKYSESWYFWKGYE